MRYRSKLPDDGVEGLRVLLKGGAAICYLCRSTD